MSLVQVAICKTIQGVPDEIQIIPYGAHDTAKGPFVLDDEGMAAIIAEFEDRANDMVIDYEHQTLYGGEAPAAGWIRKLVNKGRDGLWAVVEWTERAKAYLENREYRYLSPVFFKTLNEGRAVRLVNAALTNQPAIDGMVPLVNKGGTGCPLAEGRLAPDNQQKEVSMERLLELLGLKAGATEEQAVEAVTALAKDAAQLAAIRETLGLKPEATAEEVKTAVAAMKEGGVIVVAHKDVLDALGLKEGASLSEVKGTIVAMKQGSEQTGDLAKEVAALKEKLAKRDADELVEAAMKEGKVTPATEQWARDYAAKDLEGFKAFVAKATAVVPTGEIAGGGGIVHGGGGGCIGETQLAVNKALGIDEETFKKYNKEKE